MLLAAIKKPGMAIRKFPTVFKNMVADIIGSAPLSESMPVFVPDALSQKRVDLLILDTVFPHPLSPFRLQEFCSYLEYFPNSLVLSTGEHIPVFKDTRKLDAIIKEFEMQYPDLKDRVIATDHNINNYKARLAYVTFLNNVNMFLETLEINGIPFVFTLYPVGGFQLNQTKSNHILQRVFGSPLFRKVIVTQRITYDYLAQKKLCPMDKVEYIYGVVTPLDVLKASKGYQKPSFGCGKNTLDICFVAHKYMARGIDKGYDVFINVARKLTRLHDNIHFHVVGNFNKSDIPAKGLENRITFYGLKSAKWFETFYRDKDIILSPNIPFKLLKGAFDGFPTASCTEAGLRKVAVFCTDELRLNDHFVDNEEVVIIPHDADGIVRIIEALYREPARLRSIGEKGAAKMREVYSYEGQILPRLKILENEINQGTNIR